jgi:hypothetical protein
MRRKSSADDASILGPAGSAVVQVILFCVQAALCCLAGIAATLLGQLVWPLNLEWGSFRRLPDFVLWPLLVGAVLGFLVPHSLDRYGRSSRWVWLVPLLFVMQGVYQFGTGFLMHLVQSGDTEGVYMLLYSAPLACSLGYSVTAWLAPRLTRRPL